MSRDKTSKLTNEEAYAAIQDLQRLYSRVERNDRNHAHAMKEFKEALYALYQVLPARALYRHLPISRQRLYQIVAEVRRKEHTHA